MDDGGADGADPRNPMWRLYAEHGRGNWEWVAGGALATVAGRLLGLVPAYIVGLAVDSIFLGARPFGLPFVPADWLPAATARWAQVEVAVGVLLAATLAGAALSWIDDYAWSVFAQRTQHDLRAATFERLQALDLAFFTHRRTGELMSVLNNDVNALETFLADAVSSSLWILATVGGIGAVMLSLNAPLTLAALLPIPLLAVFTLVFARVIEPRYLAVREEIGDLNARLENTVSGIETVKTANAETYEAARTREASLAYLASNLSAIRARITFFPGLNVISGVGFAVTFLLGSYWVLFGPPFGLAATLTPGEFVTFVIYAQQFVWPIVQFGDIVDDYERAKAAGTRVYGLSTREREIRDAPDATPLDVGAGRVAYDDVSFSYHRPGGNGDDGDGDGTNGGGSAVDDTDGGTRVPVLRDVSFAAEGGETIGVVGPTGAGKSTLLKLLPRLYDVDSGAVRVDGRDVRNVTVDSLRGAIGYVGQDPFLFYGTVRENVRYGSFEASDAAVEAAAKRAQAHAFIERLPDGYETMVGERGVKLSGGQRQRLVVARAILKDPDIMILDEATSAVDTETEALIQRALADFAADRTTFVIAHRLSTVRHADRILVVDDSEVVERGTHEDLLERDGLYANLWRVQAGEIASLPASFLERARERGDALSDED
ncbi:ABC transporter ATP-binding protein [Halarchaeum nitratireducens]|uniref:Multidrug ABC transporter ATP-binding protein n=1 Tax=Halarchaeum nitratireducens TaxID=489913 RepID=A0A830G8L2_9EURY|nr:ABC transporter ATP-binding protein [Halarchaeum nitratireducens]GGN08862.1 multidrug ABC transporter ATP-binding protein [Halarchaeum nitratireducens]